MDNKSAKNNTRLIVDVAIVCDKEFSDLFSHNRKKLLNYWTVRFRHVSMHFLTIPDVEISFHVTSVTAISVMTCHFMFTILHLHTSCVFVVHTEKLLSINNIFVGFR